MTGPELLSLATLVLWAIVAISATLAIVGGIAFWKTDTGGAKSFTLLLQRGDVLRIMAVTTIVLAAAFLGLPKTLDGTAVSAILSGIAGYVLGGLSRDARSTNNA